MAKFRIATQTGPQTGVTEVKAVSRRNGRGRARTRWVKSLGLYLWVLIPLLLYTVFKLGPMVAGVWLALLRWDGIDDPVFIGLGNFRRMLTDDQLGPALLHNVEYALGTVTGKIVLSLFLAVLLNQSLRGRGFYRTALFMPVVMSMVIVSLLWSWLYNDQFGLVNSLLRAIGLNALALDWLGSPKLALWAEIVVDIWRWYGFHMVIFLTGLQTIPQDLYEAAQVDGASRLRRFFSITLPLLQPVTMINVTIALMGALNAFDIPYLMTQGGPANATNVLALYTYLEAFKFNDLGYGAALSYALFTFIAVVVILQLKFMAPRGAAGGRE